MKKYSVSFFALLLSVMMTTSAMAKCPFTYTVYIIDGDHAYTWGHALNYFMHFMPYPNPFSFPLLHGYPPIYRVLDIHPIEGTPKNNNIQYNKDTHWNATCYAGSYVTIAACHYFEIYQDAAHCSSDQESEEPTRFQVTVGTGTLPTSDKNCVFTVTGGPNHNLTVDQTTIRCTNNIQFNITDPQNPLNLDMTTGNDSDASYNFYPEFINPNP